MVQLSAQNHGQYHHEQNHDDTQAIQQNNCITISIAKTSTVAGNSITHRSSSSSSLSPAPSLISELSLHSQTSSISLQISSQSSLQSEKSNISTQSSLGSLPSLCISQSASINSLICNHANYKNDKLCPICISSAQTYFHRCVASIKIPEEGHACSLLCESGYLYTGSTTKNVLRINLLDIERFRIFENCQGSSFENGSVRAMAIFEDKLFTAHEDHKIRVWKKSQQQHRSTEVFDDEAELRHHHHRHSDSYGVYDDSNKTYSSNGYGDTEIRKTKANKKSMRSGYVVYDDNDAISRSNNNNMISSVRASSLRFGHSCQSHGASSSSPYKLVTTMPTIRDYIRSFLPAKNYVQIRRHHKRLWIEHVDAISALSVCKEKGLLYSASWDRTVKVWRISDFKCLESVNKAHDDAINSIIVSTEGYVYTGSADSKIKVWRRQAAASPEKGNGNGSNINSYISCKSNNMISLLMQNSDTKPKLAMLSCLEGHKSAVNALALSPDGCILYSGACDRAIIVWEREGSSQHMAIAGALRGHQQAILCLSAISEFLCSGSADKTIRVWKRQSLIPGKTRMHTCVAVLTGHRGPVKSLTVSMENYDNFGGDGDQVKLTVYSGSLDHRINVWRLLKSTSNKDNDKDFEEINTNELSYGRCIFNYSPAMSPIAEMVKLP